MLRRKKMKAKVAILLCIVMLAGAGCATTPKFKVPDPFMVAQLAVATAVTVEPALKPVLLIAIMEAEKMVDQDVAGALTFVLNRFKQTERYAPLVTTAFQILIENAADLRLKPDVVAQTKMLFSNLKVILQ
jgi:hypothetical protein